MPRIIKPLTAAQVKNAKAQDKPYKLYDGGGLFLLVTPSGSNLFLLWNTVLLYPIASRESDTL